MYVLGGTHRDDVDTASVLKFDSVLGTWTEVAPMPYASHGSAACVIGSDIYVFGGDGKFEGRRGRHADALKYDSMGNTWSTLAPLPSARVFHSASALDGLVYIIGLVEIIRYDPASDAWSTLAPVLVGTYLGTSFVLGGIVYVAGGFECCLGVSVGRYNVDTNTWTAVADMLEVRCAVCSVTIEFAGPAKEEDLFDKLIATANVGHSFN
jgi:hypothetical protein